MPGRHCLQYHGFCSVPGGEKRLGWFLGSSGQEWNGSGYHGGRAAASGQGSLAELLKDPGCHMWHDVLQSGSQVRKTQLLYRYIHHHRKSITAKRLFSSMLFLSALRLISRDRWLRVLTAFSLFTALSAVGCS